MAGKYDSECAAIFESTKAMGVVLIIINGEKGHGFSVQASSLVIEILPQLLRRVANEVESDFKGVSNERKKE